MTSDLAGAQRFYSGLLGWTFDMHEGSGMDYRTFKANGPNVGGFLPLSEEMTANGARPLWAGYILVEDVDKAVAAITQTGGSVLMPARDVPTVGRIAFVADPQRAPFYVMKPQGDAKGSEAFAAYAPRGGHCAWNELVTTDQDGAQAWYGRLFGFTRIDGLDMGPMGEYRIMQNAGQDFAFGAFMQKPPAMPVSLWAYYFRVPAIDTAVDYIGANGGQVVNGPMEIPGGDFVLNGVDPQGAGFGLIGKRK